MSPLRAVRHVLVAKFRECEMPAAPPSEEFFFPFYPSDFISPISPVLLAHRKTVYDAQGGAMSALDWSQCPAVESSPEKVSGAWVFRGTRMPVATVFENLDAGATIEDIMEWFDLSREQIITVLDFTARSLTAPDRR